MSDLQDDLRHTFKKTVARYAPRSGAMSQARRYARPAVRFAGRNTMPLIGAGLLAAAGVVACANRRRIAETARPVVEEAKVRGQTLADSAGARGQELMGAARAKGGELAERLKMRRGAADPAGPADLH